MNADTKSNFLPDEMDKQVVSTVMGNKVTRGELSEAFSRVQDKKNWKNPISAVVALTDYERALTEEAISFFAGSPSFFQIVDGGKYRVTAPGYYASVGA